MLDMARKKAGARVLGPYPLGDGRFRVVIFTREGERTDEVCPSEEEAQKARLAALAELAQPCETVDKAIHLYRLHQIEKGNKPKSYLETERRLRVFFDSMIGRSLDMLAERACREIYDTLRKRLAGDSQLNYLAEAKTFLAWCDKQGWLPTGSPLRNVEGIGKRRRGKSQLRFNESRTFLKTALKRQDRGSVAAACCLLLGLRSGEVVGRVARDVDEDGRLLWIPDSKTEAGKRRVEVPEPLAELLAELAAAWPNGEAKGPGDPVFGRKSKRGRVWFHGLTWMRKQVRKLAGAAGVPYVPPHGLRGTHATIALGAGASGHVVAATLGHETPRITREVYAKPEATTDADNRKVFRVLSGGKGRH